MAINTEINERISLTIEKELKDKCKELARLEERSVNKFIINALKQYIKNNYDDKE